MSKIKKLISDTILYGVTTVVTRMLGFLMTPIYTRSFSNPSIFGVFTNMYAFAALINAILAFGMETTFFRYLNKVEEKDKSKVFNTSFTITIITSALFLCTMFLFSNGIATWLAAGSKYSVADYELFVKFFAILLSAEALSVIPFAKLRAEGRPVLFSVIKISNIVVLVLLNILFLFFLPGLIESNDFWKNFFSGWLRPGWIGNVFIANLIASVFTLVLLIPQILGFRFVLSQSMLKSMLSYSFPILIANISFIINEHLDKMMFPRLFSGPDGEQDLGVYGAVAKLAIFLNLFVTAFRLGVEPFFFSHANHENARKTYALIMDYFIIIMILVVVGISANIGWLKYFIEGSESNPSAYWAGLYIIPILLLNNVLLGVYMNLSIWYKLSDQTRYALYISCIGAILTIVLNIVFIPQYSYLGASLATTVAYVIMVFLSFYWGQKNYPIPYHVLKNVTYIIGGLVLSLGMFFVFEENFIVGNALFLLLLVYVVFSEKNKVKGFLKR